MSNLEWSKLDQEAVDTARVLAADAVEKVGNGHPGTAISLAPVAHLLFQKVLRHDPANPDWVGRDRFILSVGHSSLTLYNQLYLTGYGLELSDLKALRTWDLPTQQGSKEGCLTPWRLQELALLITTSSASLAMVTCKRVSPPKLRRWPATRSLET
jgi:transketolase N-terminal domain/subunit